MEQTLTSSEVARLLGVGASTVKRWTDSGDLRCIKTLGQHRRFLLADVEEFARRNGLRVEREPMQAVGPSRPLDIGQSSAALSVDAWVDLLLGDRLTGYDVQSALLGERSLRGTWFNVADALGALITDVGKRWMEGRLTIAQEHVISERLRRGIALCCEAMPVASNAPLALLATTESEEHTLGLALVELCLREAGYRTRWLGQRTPPGELVAALQQGAPRLVAISASQASSDPAELLEQARQVGEACSSIGARLVLGGRGRWPEVPPYGVRLDGFEQLHDYLVGR